MNSLLLRSCPSAVQLENEINRGSLEILHQFSYRDQNIDNEIWLHVGLPLSRHSRHQNTRLMGGGK